MLNTLRAVFSIVFLAWLTGITGCTPSKVAATAVLQIDETATPEEIAGAAQVLKARFEDVTPGSFPSVTSTISGHTLSFEFRGGAPTETSVRLLSSERAEFAIVAAGDASDVWVTDADVLEARTATKAGAEFLGVKLKPEAGKRLEARTAANVGKMLAVNWDGREVTSLQIQGAYGENFEFPVPSEDLGRIMQATLGHGRLQIRMRSFDYRVAP